MSSQAANLPVQRARQQQGWCWNFPTWTMQAGSTFAIRLFFSLSINIQVLILTVYLNGRLAAAVSQQLQNFFPMPFGQLKREMKEFKTLASQLASSRSGERRGCARLRKRGTRVALSSNRPVSHQSSRACFLSNQLLTADRVFIQFKQAAELRTISIKCLSLPAWQTFVCSSAMVKRRYVSILRRWPRLPAGQEDDATISLPGIPGDASPRVWPAAR